MSDMINFGIDLGTTNSLIARYSRGAVEVFRNPTGFKETLPSVVGFRKERILVGDQARAYDEKDPKNVVSRFKRKMGTTESYKIKSLGQSKTPVELSAFVLKELKTFVQSGETVDAAVITIPASFDTIQSNATKEAGYQAGLKQVILLQEPIAASLAYANKQKDRDLRNSQWLVYDLGGGTFDVALVKIVNGELKVIDHEGDNFLGGMDFDALIVERLVVPRLEAAGTFSDLLAQLKSDSGKYNTLWPILLHRAEEAKVALSVKTSAEIEVDVKDDAGEDCSEQIAVTRSEYEELIKPHIDRTAQMIQKILTRNSIQPADVQFVLMVGGVTFTPFVRKRISELLQIPVNTEVDPVTAVVMGAAHFAATKEKRNDIPGDQTAKSNAMKVRVAYNRASQDIEELFSARIDGDTKGLFYRIRREDGGFDSGLKPLTNRISEDLPLVADAFNTFVFQVLDAHNNPVSTDFTTIQIAQGKYSVAGQPVPQDICLVVDDFTQEGTKLVPLFEKNSILPARKPLTVTASRTVLHGSSDALTIMVVEGPAESIPEENLVIGELVIGGKQVVRDIIKGTDIELTVEMSESRDLTLAAYVSATKQEFKEVFVPKQRHVSVDTLHEQVRMLSEKLDAEIQEANKNENFEVAGQLHKLTRTVEELDKEAATLSMDDSTDDRYKLEDRKMRLAQEIGVLTKGKKIERMRVDYLDTKGKCAEILKDNGNDHEKRVFNQIIEQEPAFLNSGNALRLQRAINDLDRIRFGILRRTPAFLVDWFNWLVGQRQRFNDQVQAKSLIDAGKAAMNAENYDRLAEVNFGLSNLLPQEDQTEVQKRFTGISV